MPCQDLDVLMVDAEAMGQTHGKFVQYKREGKLLSPDTVGAAIAGMAATKDMRLRERSGEFVQWDDNSISNSINEESSIASKHSK